MGDRDTGLGKVARGGEGAILAPGRGDQLHTDRGLAGGEPAGDLWGTEIPKAVDALRTRYGKKTEVVVSAIGPAGENKVLYAGIVSNERIAELAPSGPAMLWFWAPH